MATTSAAPALPKGLPLAVAKLLAGYLTPGVVVTLLLQNVVVLPAALAPVAGVLGLGVR